MKLQKFQAWKTDPHGGVMEFSHIEIPSEFDKNSDIGVLEIWAWVM